MNILQILREFPKANEYLNFNETERRKWVATIASKLPAGTHILDVGAGPCRYKPFFSHCQYEAQDFAQYQGVHEGLFQQDWNYGKLDYVSDITSIPVPDESFDAILCTEVLEHVPEPIEALREMARILKPQGHLFLTAPLGSGIHQSPYHFYGGYTPYFYKKFLSEFGLEVVSIQPNGGLFKHYLQESARVGAIIMQGKRRFSPKRILIGLILMRLFPVLFYHLDQEQLIEEYSVGFFVTARRL